MDRGLNAPRAPVGWFIKVLPGLEIEEDCQKVNLADQPRFDSAYSSRCSAPFSIFPWTFTLAYSWSRCVRHKFPVLQMMGLATSLGRRVHQRQPRDFFLFFPCARYAFAAPKRSSAPTTDAEICPLLLRCPYRLLLFPEWRSSDVFILPAVLW